MSEKIAPQHIARRAILYVRQSSAQQLVNNEESRRLQYAMRQRLHALGWKDVEVIDEDLGKSAAGFVTRRGFQRLMAEVSLGLVGVVAAREVSRFARNSREWQQLIEICRVVDTLLVDHEAVYAPRSSNDRLLLGLKGSLNEYELDLLRLRGLEARREKASRGDLLAGVPIGYCISDESRLSKTPDLRVRQMVELVFAKFFELGSARQVMLWLLDSKMQVPVTRDRRGAVQWIDPTADYVTRLVTNPAYAGAYAYGRTRQRSRVVDGQLRTTSGRVRRGQWSVLLHDRHEGYITWQEFERAETMLASNTQARGGHGVARGGGALLAGLVFCRRCGVRMGTGYSGTSSHGRYQCDAANLRRGAPRCISFSALDIRRTDGPAIDRRGATRCHRGSTRRMGTRRCGRKPNAAGARTTGRASALRSVARATAVRCRRSRQSHRGARVGAALEHSARVGCFDRTATGRGAHDTRQRSSYDAPSRRVPRARTRSRTCVECRNHGDGVQEAHRAHLDRTGMG